MVDTADRALTPATEGEAREPEAFQHLREAIASGQHWYRALLETIALWRTPQEVYRGRQYRYLIEKEVFDWLALAERLLESVNSLVPEKEVKELLQHGRPPLELSRAEYRRLLGSTKYRALLNYFYGVTVEEALLHQVEEAVCKEQLGRGLRRASLAREEAFRRIYEAPRAELLRAFQEEKGYPERPSLSPEEHQEFTYWLFKYRLKHGEPARVASDTKKGLDYLQRTGRRILP